FIKQCSENAFSMPKVLFLRIANLQLKILFMQPIKFWSLQYQPEDSYLVLIDKSQTFYYLH
ncbi:hypothetical protein UQ18_28160, partial [Escherichia coli]